MPNQNNGNQFKDPPRRRKSGIIRSNLDLLVPEPEKEWSEIRWGTVTEDGTQVLLDGDTEPLPDSTVSLVNLMPRRRAAVERFGKTLRITGLVTPTNVKTYKATGWDSSVEVYSPGSSDPTIMEINGIIYFSGAMRVKSAATSGTLAQLTAWACPPSQLYQQVFRCQGTGNNSWGMRVNSSGEVVWERYGPDSPAPDTWLPFAVSWPSAQIFEQ